MKQLKLLSLILAICLLCNGFCGCNAQTAQPNNDDEIVILFTNDMHGIVSGSITLSQVAAYKKYMQTKTQNVLLVDCGDAIQGSSLSTITTGSYMIDIMNEIGYDYAIFGNHEFDFGQERLAELVSQAKAQYLCCNITYSGSGETVLTQTKPYEIVQFGDTSVAFIGVTTPETISSSSPAYFMEDEEYVYDFCGGETNAALIACVQKNVDEARAKGADYVIVLAHMGIGEEAMEKFESDALIRATNGIDAVLDGHSHSVCMKVCVENKDGDMVLLAQTGTKLSYLGQLVISGSGILSVSLIDELVEDDEAVKAKIDAINAEYSELFDCVVAHSDAVLPIRDENGARTVRNRETAMGDLCADAFRAVFDADISYSNGGGIRAGFPEGDITYQNILDVLPYGNVLCLAEVTGQDILDMLEYFVHSVQSESVSEDKTSAVGESGSFPNMSGITFTVDTRIESPVVLDENDMLISIDESKPRRVSDVKIQSGDEYLPIDVTKTYTLAATEYLILNGGCGMEFLMANHTVLQKSSTPDYQALADYITKDLDGDLSAYQTPQNRITFLR